MLGNKSKRILAVILSAAMLLPMASLTACKKKGAGAGQATSNVNPNLLPTNPDGIPHGDYVLETDPYYSDTSFAFEIPDNKNKERKPDRKEMGDTCLLNNGVACGYSRIYELTQEEIDEMDEQDIFDPDELMRKYEIMQMRQDSGIIIYSQEGEMIANIDLPGDDDVQHLYPLRDGNFIASVFHVEYTPTGDGGWEFDLLLINEKGEILRNEKVSPLLELEVGNMGVIQLENGKYLFYGDQQVYLMDENWTILKKGAMTNYQSPIVEIGGKYYEIINDVILTVDSSVPDYKYSELDTETLAFSEAKAMDENTPNDWLYMQDSGSVMINDGEGIVKIDLITGNRENIFRWGDTDIYGTEVRNARVLPDGDILLLTEKELIRLHKEATNPFAGRRILKVGIADRDYAYAYYPLVNAYNKRSESLGRVYIYFPGGNPYGFDAAKKADDADRLLLDMKSGTGPDILLNYSKYGHFNSDSILIDLNPYIDGEKGLDRSLYFDNIFRAFEDNGKLYQMPISVAISALVGNPEALGGITDWTVEEFEKKISALPEDMNPILYWYHSEPGYSRIETLDGTGVLLQLLYHNMTQYVDYDKGEVRFDSDSFRVLLEAARLAAPRINEQKLHEFENLYDSWNEYALMVQDGVCALTPMERLQDLWYFDEYVNVCNGNAVFIGWPTEKGTGLAAEAYTSIGISAFSEAKDEAWDFLRFVLSPETLDYEAFGKDFSGISVCRQTQLDSMQYEITYGDPYSGNPKKLTSEEADKFLALVERISSRVCKNPTILEIIIEEAPAYFDGSKTAEEVSKIIQSRVSMLIAEKG